MSRLSCQGCGAALADDDPAPYRCPRAGDGGDHVVARTLDDGVAFARDGARNPFVRWRALSHAYSLWRARGQTDAAFVALVEELDAAIAAVAGHGFVITPFARSAPLSEALGLSAPGGVWVKDDTGNVSGSHKGRHLMGLCLLGEVQARTGVAAPGGRLAIASCGNAALAAAVVARAWRRPLDVFIPEDAHAKVVAELERLGAAIHVCARTPGVAGDPCYHAFRRAVDAGALPFCCQGPDHGLTIEGGETLAWEMIDALLDERVTLDRLFVQVGGGALASACVRGWQDAARAGVAVTLPRLHPVQTEGAFPLKRAWERLMARLVARLGLERGGDEAALAERVRQVADAREVAAELAYAAGHRAEFMWPWESTPHSIAHGILDDETYDWWTVLQGTIVSGGVPLVVSEAQLATAHRLGRETTGIDVDPTGAAGLAGVVALAARGELGTHEHIAVLFTGATR